MWKTKRLRRGNAPLEPDGKQVRDFSSPQSLVGESINLSVSTEIVQITFTRDQLEKILGAVVTRQPGTKLIRMEALKVNANCEMTVLLKIEKIISNKEVH
jgi:hypothetical protein